MDLLDRYSQKRKLQNLGFANKLFSFRFQERSYGLSPWIEPWQSKLLCRSLALEIFLRGVELQTKIQSKEAIRAGEIFLPFSAPVLLTSCSIPAIEGFLPVHLHLVVPNLLQPEPGSGSRFTEKSSSCG